LDRDGTLNVKPGEHQYVSSADDFEWLDGAPEGIARLASAGYFLGIVSNQRGVALGATAPAVLRAIEDRIQERLSPLGCRIDVFRYCVHDLSARCSCRKPAPGLILDIAADYSVDLTRSWMIGDDAIDISAGRAAGCRTALIGSDAQAAGADVVAGSLAEVSRILTRKAKGVRGCRSAWLRQER
jgi:D-glycero-D-manno-heptose 1,7-bisphosphate phosphatase